MASIAALDAELLKYPPEDVFDGCTAAAHVAYACSDTSFIYPITPSSAMAEIYEVWATQLRKNIYGQVCTVRQLQSEAGAAGAVHGSLSVGSITVTFTASQGLLLMIPPMYKIAGELIPAVFHVSARAVAGQALSIFGDHSDVMAVRQCGWAMLSSDSVQQAMDLATVSHMATLEASVPFVHFFDGFRTSHELQKIKILSYKTIKDLMPMDLVQKFRDRALNPAHPYLKGTSQGPEVYFQNVEAANKYYESVPDIIERCMAKFAAVTGRQYHLFEYFGAEDAEDVLVVMGAAGPVIQEAVTYLNTEKGQKVGVVTVHLYRPWKLQRFLEAMPKTTKRIAVLDRTKESGSLGEPLFLDVAASIQARPERQGIRVIGGRYGLGSKDFIPEMVLAVLDNLRSDDYIHGFTVGVIDDVTNLSLKWEHYKLSTVPKGTTQCMFWGMGSDGTVGANKNVIKILGNSTPLYVQGYFSYSAHKAGGLTVSHLRFGPNPITSQYLLQQSDYIAVHRGPYIQTYNCLETIKENAIFVLNTNWTDAELEDQIPGSVKRLIATRKVEFYTIDANKVAAVCGMGRRVNNILMTAYFRLSGVLPFEQALGLFKAAIKKTYGNKGMHVVEANWKAVDRAIENIHKVDYDQAKWAQSPDTAMERRVHRQFKLEGPPAFVTNVMVALEKMEGDRLPVSAFSSFAGGVLPLCTASYEKRGIAMNVPIVDMDLCTQCNQCAFVCPHAAIRPFLLDEDEGEKAPADFAMKKAKGNSDVVSYKYRIQVSPLDCTGCELCSMACPAECLKMTALDDVRERETSNWDFAVSLPERSDLITPEERTTLKGSQMFTPMLEFSGACEGCGETPYVKLMTQLFGERLVIANATGCSSIWGASYPSNPYTVNDKGYGPAWGNSLFEDNAEYGFGMAVATEHRRQRLIDTVTQVFEDQSCLEVMSEELTALLKEWLPNTKKPLICQKVFEKSSPLLEAERGKHPLLQQVYNEKDLLPRLSQWIVGGDGWAYDIGFGGLDHVLASGVNVNILVLDTEVYSNTGGQKSKATTVGAVHKFASGGHVRNKKDLGALAMEYQDVYVASVASSANMTQTIRAFVEAEEYEGTSLIIAYSPCIEHQYIKPFTLQIEHCKLAVDSGYWPLYRYNPILMEKNENPFQLDCRKIKADLADLLRKENRFGTLRRQDPQLAVELEGRLKKWAEDRFKRMQIRAAGEQQLTATAPKGDHINVLYGSETGCAEDVAKRIGIMMKTRNIPVTVAQLDEVTVDEVAAMTQVLLVCSTAGQGEFPGNAKEFYESLASSEYDGSDIFKDMKFAVFGLGDTSYVYFNQCAMLLDKRFSELGAKRILPYGQGDDQHEDKYETVLGDWLPSYWVESGAPEPKNVSDDPSPSMFKVEHLKSTGGPVEQCVHYGTKLVKVTENRRLTPNDYDVDVRHLSFDLTGTGFKYALGDSLAIWPQNDVTVVDKFLKDQSFDGDQLISIKPSGTETSAKHMSLFAKPLTIRQLFVECLDIFGKPARSFYEGIYKYCQDKEEKAKAKRLLDKDKKAELGAWTVKETVTCYDVMTKKFPSIKLTLEQYIDIIPLVKPRYYSIASSQKFLGEAHLELCVGIVQWKTSDETERYGECTGYISRAVAGQSKFCCALKATAFNLPPTDKHPMIVAGMGTGLAPFRAFIQFRAYQKKIGKECGPLVVYFGCRYQKKDFLYGEELQKYVDDGVITHLVMAFSRDNAQKMYIQHKMRSDPDLPYDLLVNKDGYFYLCGSAKQVPIDVAAAMAHVLEVKGGMANEQAVETITKWKIAGKYNVEAW